MTAGRAHARMPRWAALTAVIVAAMAPSHAPTQQVGGQAGRQALASGLVSAAQQSDLVSRSAAACATDNPFLATTRYALGADPAAPGLVAFQYEPSGTGQTRLASSGEIGSAFGIAHHPSSPFVYVAACMKRGSAFGPGGPGGVYRVDLATGSTVLWLVVDNAGSDLHDPAGDYWPDHAAIQNVGRSSLGDIDLSPDGRTLFVTNLYDRTIRAYRVSDRLLNHTIDIGSAGQPWHAANARPFGLAVRGSTLYHGVIDSAEARGPDAVPAAYVYASKLDGSNMTLVNALPLFYDRGAQEPPWREWHDRFRYGGPNRDRDPQPMLTDIEFTDSGAMVLGFRDRLGDITFMGDDLRPNPPGEEAGRPGGDLVLSPFSGGSWSTPPMPPEFYQDDTGGHGETGFGGLARVAAADVVVSTGISPLATYTGGAYWFDNRTGQAVRRMELYAASSRDNFGKANGLGDLELLCPAVPRPSTVYLPLVAAERCPKGRPVDVALVLDMSTSMRRPTPSGGTKLERTLHAAYAFVELLRGPMTLPEPAARVAVAGFNNSAWIEAPVGPDPDLARQAIDRLPDGVREGTRLDEAFRIGLQALSNETGLPGDFAVLVVLTDGLPNKVPPAEDGSMATAVLRSAAAVKAQGILVYTIGVGSNAAGADLVDRVDVDLLTRAASTPSHFFHEPTGDDLDVVYRRIWIELDVCGGPPRGGR